MAKIKTLTFTYDCEGNVPGQIFDVPGVLLLVGPNESGKTLALSQITSWYDGSLESIDGKLFSGATFEVFDQKRARKFLFPLKGSKYSEDSGEICIWTGNAQGSISESPSVNIKDFCSEASFEKRNWRGTNLARLRISPKIDTYLSIGRETDALPLRPGARYKNLHQLLLSDRQRLDKLNRIIKPASGFYLAVQLMENGKVRIQLNPEPPPSEIPSMILSLELEEYYSKGILPEEFGDGLRTFIGLVLSIFPFEHKLIALDEPEVHLHPPLVRRLAQELVLEIERRDGQLIVATHSPEFVAACINSTNDVSMARLTYSKVSGKTTAKVISKSDLKPFVSDSVVRNIDTLTGIFHESVVLVEGVFDKIAYTEFNRCLQQEGKGREIHDPHFVSVGGKTSVLKVAEIMRKTGTPTAAIVDFDALLLGWSDSHLKMLGIPEKEHHWMLRIIGEVKNSISSLLPGLKPGANREERFKAKSEVNKQGIKLLEGTHRIEAKELLNRFTKYGYFVVACGDTETFLARTLGFSIGNMSKEQVVVETAMQLIADRKFMIPENLSEPTMDLWSLLFNISIWVKGHVE